MDEGGQADHRQTQKPTILSELGTGASFAHESFLFRIGPAEGLRAPTPEARGLG